MNSRSLNFRLLLTFAAALITATAFHARAEETLYRPRGIGGGGAMSGLSISPVANLRFVGTDMGTLFRSTDGGKHWVPVDQAQAKFDSDLDQASGVGFSADPKVAFFAEAGRTPKRSTDAGVHWSAIPVPLHDQERIRYWVGDPKNSKIVLCATTEGLLRSVDGGKTFSRVAGLSGPARGTVYIVQNGETRIYHANEKGILVSSDGGETFAKWYTAPAAIRSFAGGADAQGVTFALLDTDAKACTWAKRAGDSSDEEKRKTLEECGFVWIHRGKGLDANPRFERTTQEGGRFVAMAMNDPRTIYVTGGDWVRQMGSRVWVSRDAGKTWALRFQVYDWDRHPYQPWPKNRLEYSAAGLDVGWDDNAPFSFVVNPRNSAEAGWTGHFFFHWTADYGEHWQAPFTHYAGTGERKRGERWSSTGLEVTSALRMKFSPANPKLAYVAMADLGGLVTEDGGETFRITKAKENTNYDYAFDPAGAETVFAASGSRHDFPLNANTPLHEKGGIFSSKDRGRTWRRLTPDNEEYNRQFLSVAYDPVHHVLYGGTEGAGIARSLDGGAHWKFFNPGLPTGDLVIPQLEADPRDGSIYALVTGNAPGFTNAADTGLYRLVAGAEHGTWEFLRGSVKRPAGVDPGSPLWQFPSAFAVDFSRPARDVLWLTDIENKGAWLATGVWKSTDSGKTWARMTQFTHPTSIAIVETSPGVRAVTVSGLYDVSGNWGAGGSLTSTDGGATWVKNEKLPLRANLFGYTPDPRRPRDGFFLFFGGGIQYGPLRAGESPPRKRPVAEVAGRKEESVTSAR